MNVQGMLMILQISFGVSIFRSMRIWSFLPVVIYCILSVQSTFPDLKAF